MGMAKRKCKGRERWGLGCRYAWKVYQRCLIGRRYTRNERSAHVLCGHGIYETSLPYDLDVTFPEMRLIRTGLLLERDCNLELI